MPEGSSRGHFRVAGGLDPRRDPRAVSGPIAWLPTTAPLPKGSELSSPNWGGAGFRTLKSFVHYSRPRRLR